MKHSKCYIGADVGYGASRGTNMIVRPCNGAFEVIAECPDQRDAAHIVRCVNAMDEAVAAMGRSVQILNTWASANPNTAEVQSIASRPIAVAADMFAVMVDLKQALRLAEAPERPQSPASEL